ncbi:hypothetical protein Glo7428_2271 [Gloeocapsa sp. PCC 7428]|uniref:hypothetical protein n=1 Tax=Gloeocapsa sp. PCC 7428 TaxID=1173026 RepID=UPI0002A5CE75|nr:hypothetical protein [Gloeocapsa sp. PCC 7428]AFZ30787.1 hypothetical protein Glo7428_2271 [Gloeocapsa sp. PCC 7428]
MLTQLSCLSVAADGRYATAEELQFIKNYFQSFDVRLSAYEKMTKAESEIRDCVEAKMRDIEPSLFQNTSGDFTSTWRKDIIQLLTYATATFRTRIESLIIATQTLLVINQTGIMQQVTSLNKNSHWLETIEGFAVIGSVAGAIASVISQQAIFASLPLSAAVVLNWANCKLLIVSIQQNQQAITQVLEQSTTPQERFASISTQVAQL